MQDGRRFGCPVCGQGLVTPGRCPNLLCGSPARHFSVAFAIGLHGGALRHAISRYKYRGERWLSGVFANMLARYLLANAPWFEEFDLLAGVPTYPGSSRGWDPVGEMLLSLRPLVTPGWEVAPTAVVKTTDTPRMQGLTWLERRHAATGSLRRALAVPDPSVVRGSRVLVLDDVLTDGSTLDEVARALRVAGASEVAGLVLARPAWTPEAPSA